MKITLASFRIFLKIFGFASQGASPVSTTPAANNENNITISDCLHLKVNLKNKIYLYVNSTTQRCSNKIFKTFLIEDFFQLLPVLTTPVVQF
jgi:hypothetical protein